MKVLLLAYACEPGAGSEYGVGWMVPTTMAARYPECQIYVLTRSRCMEKIEKALNEIHLDNLHFLFYDIPKCIFYKNEMQSHWGEQINYLSWQILVRKFIKKEDKLIGFDIIHHLTFNQYRTPSAGFWLNKPFVMGPIGGAECIASAFWQDLEANSVKKERIRQRGSDLRIFKWLNNRSNNKKMILCSSSENFNRLKPYCGQSDIKQMPAIAFSPMDFDTSVCANIHMPKDKSFEMIYAGKALDWKGIRIYLRAAKKAYLDNHIRDFKIKLVGIRFEEEQRRVIEWVNELGLQNNVVLIPFIQRKDLLIMEARCDLSVYPAFRDSGSMSVLEACALACPSICFNAGGQDIFPNDILLKIPVMDTYEKCLYEFAQKLLWAYTNRDELKQIGLKSQKWVCENLTWNKRVDDFMEIYRNIIRSGIYGKV